MFWFKWPKNVQFWFIQFSLTSLVNIFLQFVFFLLICFFVLFQLKSGFLEKKTPLHYAPRTKWWAEKFCNSLEHMLELLSAEKSEAFVSTSPH